MKLDHINIVFIVCNGRSGSTLLQRIFDAHPHICAPIESKFVLHLSTKYKNEKNWNNKKINQFVNDLFSNRKFKLFWNVNKNELLKKFSTYTLTSFEDACKVVYLSYPSFFEKEEIKLIVDKNPAHARFLPELSKLFPSAKYIHLIRDPRSVIYSQMKAFHYENVFKLALEWNLMNRLILSHKLKNPQKFYTIKYETLVKNPSENLKYLLDFLEINFISEILKSHTLLKENINENQYLNLPHHQNIKKPITTQFIDKWKYKLKIRQIRVINTITFSLATEFEYILENSNLKKKYNHRVFFEKVRLNTRHIVLKKLFKLPFPIRKQLYKLVSFFFDKKYKRYENH